LKSHEKQIESQVIDSNNLGAFYKHINKRITYKNSIGTLLSKDGNLISDDGEKAALFNNYFASVATADDGRVPLCDVVLGSDCVIDNVEFTKEQLKVAKGKLNQTVNDGVAHSKI